MVIRKIREDEAKKVAELLSVAFEFPVDDKKSNEEIIKDQEENELNRPARFWRERWAAFKDDDETLMACLQAIPYPVRFDGHAVMMGGIAGVCTYPQYRRHGAIRECFRMCFQEMHEKGYIFSMLYPFSRAYYRQFGYESGIESIQWTINFKGVKPFKTEGCACLRKAGDDLTDIKAVYDAFLLKYNFMVIREDVDFGYITKLNPFQEKKYAYVWKSSNGIPKGYMIFKKERVGERAIMDCSDFVFSDAEGFKGLMDLALSLSHDYQAIRFRLPARLSLGTCIPEGNETNRELQYLAMLRIVDVEKAFQLAHLKGSGRLSVRIHDFYCPWNDGVWHLQFNDGESACIFKDNSEAFDMEMNIATFSALLGGCREKGDFPYFNDLRIVNETEDIDKVFYRKNSFHWDFY